MRDDRGESLIELIVAMAILGTTMVTIIGGFLALAKVSGIQRDQSKAMAALSAASEYAKNRACAEPGVHSCAAETVPTSSVPHDADTTITISSAASNTDTGLTQFVVTVTTGGATFTNTLVVR